MEVGMKDQLLVKDRLVMEVEKIEELVNIHLQKVEQWIEA